jgi:hypothetical protein
MVDTLNSFELIVLDKISADYPFLRSHISFLRVKSRESTGVGLYVNFSYLKGENDYQPIPANYSALSSNAVLHIEGLKHGLAYEIAITNGWIDFLELVTYGEEWDGLIRNFWFD